MAILRRRDTKDRSLYMKLGKTRKDDKKKFGKYRIIITGHYAGCRQTDGQTGHFEQVIN